MAGDGFRFAQMRERVVVMAGAIADAVTEAVECRQRHQHDVGNEFGRGRRRLGDAERPQHQPVGRTTMRETSATCRAHVMTGSASRAPSAASIRIRGTGSISLRIGE